MSELETLETLDTIVRREPVSVVIDSIVSRVEQNLTQNPEASIAWEPVLLATYGKVLPNMISSSWVFVIHAQTSTGAERHPNSCQRMMSYRGAGDTFRYGMVRNGALISLSVI
jgi:hypothetical protein